MNKLKKSLKLSVLLFLSSIFITNIYPQNLINNQFNSSIKDEPVKIISSIEKISAEEITFSFTFILAENVHVYRSEKLFFQIKEDSIIGLKNGSIIFPVEVNYKNFDDSIVKVFTNNQQILVIKKINPAIKDWSYTGSIDYQACDESLCYSPDSSAFSFSSDNLSTADITEKKTTAANSDMPEIIKKLDEYKSKNIIFGYQKSKPFIDFLQGKNTTGNNPFKQKSMLLTIILILLGGLALNLTPCVLPMIPITVSIIGAGAQASSRRQGFFIGSIYGAGMAIAYGLLGIIVVLSGSTFGTLNATWWFNLAIALIFIVLSLAMFDMIPIDLTKFRSMNTGGENQNKKLITIFSMGIIAALLAGACVAPVVIFVIVYAADLYANNNNMGLLLPLILGAGMALPWPLVGAGLSLLPKPGKWMNVVKYIFGVIIFIIAVYYGYESIKIIKHSMTGNKISNSENTGSLQWHTSLEEGLQIAKAQNKPLFIDFWASWCKNCATMDITTFRDPQVITELQKFVLVKYQAEKPNKNPHKQILDYFGSKGLPTYVILKNKD